VIVHCVSISRKDVKTKGEEDREWRPVVLAGSEAVSMGDEEVVEVDRMHSDLIEAAAVIVRNVSEAAAIQTATIIEVDTTGAAMQVAVTVTIEAVVRTSLGEVEVVVERRNRVILIRVRILDRRILLRLKRNLVNRIQKT